MISSVKAGELVEGATIKQPCSDKNNGRWYCVTHKLLFDNQFSKDVHIHDKKDHKFAWICNEHGVEKP
jgi:hypothetical protein